MKKSKILVAIGGASMILAGSLVACGSNSAEIAVVTDVGLLMDGGFNQGTYEGAEAYAKENNKTYKYYQPANGSEATDADREAAMRLAIKNGAKVIVAPGFLQQAAMEKVAKESPDVKFVFVDGWNFGLSNVTAISYKEQESGFMAGYAVVKDGYTKLGGTFGGAGSNPACNRFAYGFVQGANAAAATMSKDVEVKISFQYGASFGASNELKTQISGWYGAGTEVVFACGGSMVNSVISAAEATTNGKVVGVDVDQSNLSKRVITSAVKGLAASVKQVLGQFYANEWDSKLADKTQNLGAKENATGLPTAEKSWRFSTFTKEEYTTLFNSIAAGTTPILSDLPADCNSSTVWAAFDVALTNTTISFE